MKAIYEELDARKYALSLENCVTNKEYWRVFTSPLVHTSPIHLFLNITCLWNLRYIEVNYGSWFVVKYSLILLLAESILTFLSIKLVSRMVNNPAVTQVLSSLQYMGCSGLVLSWLAFQSMEVLNRKSNALFLLFGLLPIPPFIAPLVVLVFCYLFAARSNGLPNSCGILAGYLLGSGFLSVLSGTYWTVCFLLNILIVTIVSVKPSAIGGAGDRNVLPIANSDVQGDGQRILPVRYYRNAHDGEFLETTLPDDNVHVNNRLGDDASAVRTGSRGNIELTNLSSHGQSPNIDDEESKDEDSLAPLLAENPNERNRDTYSRGSWSRLWAGSGTVNGSNISNSPLANGSASSILSPRVPHRILVNQDDSV